jgi:hypothetical protein
MEREGLALLCVGLSHHPFSAINKFVAVTAFIIGPTTQPYRLDVADVIVHLSTWR